jgi:DNA polymerase-4
VGVDLWAQMPQLPGLVLGEPALVGAPIVHVDADAFFVSVARRDAPELTAREVVVGDDIVMSASYEARAWGVRAGMPIGRARALCTDLAVVAPTWDAYATASHDLFHFLDGVAIVVESASLEEAYLDLGLDDWDDAYDAAHRIRRRVQDQLGLSVSAGVARTKVLAKVACRRAKPGGVEMIDRDAEPRARTEMRIGEIGGVGRATQSKLKVQGIESIAELEPYSARELAPIVGTAMARRLYRIAHALDDTRVLPRRPRPAKTVVSRPIQLPFAFDWN